MACGRSSTVMRCDVSDNLSRASWKIIASQSRSSSERCRTRSSCAFTEAISSQTFACPAIFRITRCIASSSAKKPIWSPTSTRRCCCASWRCSERSWCSVARFGGTGDGVAFQRFADELAVRDRGQVDRCDEAADLRHDAQQAVLHQALEDLADRRAADAVLFGEPRLRQRLSRPHFSTQNIGVKAPMEAVALASSGLEPGNPRQFRVECAYDYTPTSTLVYKKKQHRVRSVPRNGGECLLGLCANVALADEISLRIAPDKNYFFNGNIELLPYRSNYRFFFP